MIRTRDIMACLPLLASILGDRYGVKVIIGGDKACTDGKTIYLPTLPLDCNDTLLALVRGYCDHEAAHIRHTDFEVFKAARLTPMQTHLWNSIEDWRVEEQLVSIFPGCRHNFQWLIHHFFGEHGVPVISPSLSVLDWVLLTVRSWALPAIEPQRDVAAVLIDSVFPGLRSKLEAVLARVRQSCRNTRESIAYALELAAIIEKYAQQPQMPQTPQERKSDKTGKSDTQKTGEKNGVPDSTDEQDKASDSANTDAEQGAPDKMDTPDGQESDAQPEGQTENQEEQAEGKDDNTDCSTQSEENGSSSSQAQSLQTDCPSESAGADTNDSQAQPHGAMQPPHPLSDLLQASADELPKHIGELMAESLNANQEKDGLHGLSVARTGYKHTMPLRDDFKEDALKSSVALRTRLQALLQAKAQQHCVTGRRGKLHTQRLYALAVDNPRVFIKQGEKLMTSTAVHLLLDCSASMRGARMELASLACYAVAKALEGCKGVSVGVSLFPANCASTHSYETTVAPLVRHRDRVHHNFNMYSVGNTPLAESLWWVMQQMHPLREARKIILVLSDGAPDSITATQDALIRGRSLGYEIMGLGIQDFHMEELMPKTSRTIDDLQSLAPAMFDMLQKALLHQEGGRS